MYRYKLDLPNMACLLNILEKNTTYTIEWTGASPFQTAVGGEIETFDGVGRLVSTFISLEVIGNLIVVILDCQQKEGVFEHVETSELALSVMGFGDHWNILGN